MFQHSNYRGARRKRGTARNGNLFENIMKENFPNLAKEIDFQEVQEAQRIPKKLDPRKHTPKHIIITLPKIKQKGRIFIYKGVPIRLSYFSKETLQARRGSKEVFEVMKGKDLHPRWLYPAPIIPFHSK